jgi:hypothetical protein
MYLLTNTATSAFDLKKVAKVVIKYGPGIAKTIWTLTDDAWKKIFLSKHGKHLGKIELPAAVTRQGLGQGAEKLVTGVVEKQYKIKIPLKDPSTTGLDIPVPIPSLGAVAGEVKPGNPKGLSDFFKQLDEWTRTGKLQPGQKVALFVYDDAGNVFLSGVFAAKVLD